jgi:hypothetical protein
VKEDAWLRLSYPNTAFIRSAAWVWPVKVIFCDTRPPGFAYAVPSVELIFHTKTTRRSNLLEFRNWRSSLVHLQHSTLRGLSLKRRVLLCSTASQRQYWPISITPGLASCVYTVASDTLDAGVGTPRPPHQHMGQLEVARIRENVFHGGG